MTKVYELKTLSAGVFQTEYCGCKINLTFRTGKGSTGTDHSELITSNPFVQDAIEHDSRYGKVFVLVAKYGDESTARNEHQQNGRLVAESRSQSGRSALFQRGVNETPAVVTEETPKKKKSGKKAKVEENVETVTEVNSVNDALYILENDLGIEITDDTDVDALMKKHHIEVKG